MMARVYMIKTVAMISCPSLEILTRGFQFIDTTLKLWNVHPPILLDIHLISKAIRKKVWKTAITYMSGSPQRQVSQL